MKKILSIFIAFLCLTIQSANADLIINELNGFNAGGVSPATVTFLQCAEDASDASTYTFTSQNVGTASSDRYTIVGIGGDDNATVWDISSVTVGGNSATEAVDYGGVSSLNNTAIYYIANPTGTSQTIVVNTSEAINHLQICVWQANNIQTGTPFATNTGFDTAAAAFHMDLNIPANGAAVGVCSTQAGSQTFTWTGLTERIDDPAIGAEANSYTAADLNQGGTASTPLSITCDATGSADTSGAVASWR